MTAEEETTATTTAEETATTTPSATASVGGEEEEDPAIAELTQQISTLGTSITEAKKSKKPKEEWDPLLRQMLNLKLKYKEMTGKVYNVDVKKGEKEKEGGGEKGENNKSKGDSSQEASDKNKEKRAKKAAEKAAKEEKKRRQREEREAREREKMEKVAQLGGAAAAAAGGRGEVADEAEDTTMDWSKLFGDLPMIQSSSKSSEGSNRWTRIDRLTKEMEGKQVMVRGHLHASRVKGKLGFAVLRSSLHTVQCVAFESKGGNKDSNEGDKDGGERTIIPSAMLKYMAGIPVESIIDVYGTLTVPSEPIRGVTQSDVEIRVETFHCVNKAMGGMPFQMEDACRPDLVKETDIGAYDHEANRSPAATETTEATEGGGGGGGSGGEGAQASQEAQEGGRVGQETRLDHRWIDLRTPANQSIFRIQSAICTLFREYLLKLNFVEIHTPKLLSGASEGGAEVFTLDYFGRPACLSMSPQLHKQMAAACGGFERVFEIGPVFRAENSNTRRHLCEFTGLDLEMVIMEHYDEVLDVLGGLFVYIFDGVRERCTEELERVREQHGLEDLVYLRETLRLDYATGCRLLREAGVDQDDYDDLSTENEKKLGGIVKEKYNTDFFIMDKYPLAVRPFYTMPDPNHPKLSNSYDIFIRGQEIVSGAQRIHEPTLLEERAKAWGIDVKTIASYVDSFRNGALPHGGGGIGLERVVMLYLGLPNIRKSSMFPRDPKRIAP